MTVGKMFTAENPPDGSYFDNLTERTKVDDFYKIVNGLLLYDSDYCDGSYDSDSKTWMVNARKNTHAYVELAFESEDFPNPPIVWEVSSASGTGYAWYNGEEIVLEYTDKSAALIITAYSGGKIIEMKKPDIESGIVDENIAGGSAVTQGDADSIKIMLWRSTDAITPLCESVTLEYKNSAWVLKSAE